MARPVSKTTTPAMVGFDPKIVAAVETLHQKVQWLSAWTIHNANHIRPSRDGLKVGGHQASSASLAAVLSALYFSVLTPRDRVAVKPHASPSFHAIQYLLGHQSRDQLEKFRALGGAQSYPSRTKDKDDIDFSTGSVGLGVAVTAFASLTQDYLVQKGLMAEKDMGRMIALMGDAELDEGNIYEALIEGYKHDLRNCWWIIDYNRQSLDATTSDRMFDRFRDIFATVGWEVINLKYGKKQQAAFEKPGGGALRDWIDACQNSLYSALIYKGGAAWRAQLTSDIGHKPGVKKLLAGYDDDGLQDLMANLGGHDIELLLETFHSIKSDKPHCFIAYTVKGWGLPFQGHKDNHAGLMNPAQMAEYQKKMGVPQGQEWEPFAGLEERKAELQVFLDAVPFKQVKNRRYEAATYAVPAGFPMPEGDTQATQVAFGKIMNDLAKSNSDMASRIVTTSPDVTVSTNLGGWVNQRGIFNRLPRADVFKEQNVVSPQKWAMTLNGQHIELGIAESNLFLLLAALGLSSSLFGQRLLPVGTLYDPFICRGLDSMIYACYQDARFMLVSTPSGITLAPEGGAHQSFNTPLIGMAQDRLAYYEPAYVDELSIIMEHGFDYMQRADGGSVYLRLSTRPIAQPKRDLTPEWRAQVLRGAYWAVPPAEDCPIVIAYCGALAPEAHAAFEQLREDVPGAGLLAITSPDRLHAEWNDSVRSLGQNAIRRDSHIENLLSAVKPGAAIVTVVDASPTTLSWLGGVCGHRVVPLGVDHFGQSADLNDLYQVYRIGSEAILDACATAFVKA
jgi:pyruvate dehydrogenase E1 component